MVGKRGHLDTDISGRGNDYNSGVITNGLAKTAGFHTNDWFLPFFSPFFSIPPEKAREGFYFGERLSGRFEQPHFPWALVDHVSVGWLVWFDELAKRRNLLKGLDYDPGAEEATGSKRKNQKKNILETAAEGQRAAAAIGQSLWPRRSTCLSSPGTTTTGGCPAISWATPYSSFLVPLAGPVVSFKSSSELKAQ